jgi:ABC-type Zn uptake system ZnuABC Zn-binding protein ZnuA
VDLRLFQVARQEVVFVQAEVVADLVLEFGGAKPVTLVNVQEDIALMKERKITVLFASNYFSRSQIDQVAQRTGATAVIVAENTDGAPGIVTYFDLVNSWVGGLAAAFGAGAH